MTPRRELAAARPAAPRLLSTPMPEQLRPAAARPAWHQGPDCADCSRGMTGTVCVHCAVDRARQDANPGEVYEIGHDALPAEVRAVLAEQQQALVAAERAYEATLPPAEVAELDARLAAITNGTHPAYHRTPR